MKGKITEEQAFMKDLKAEYRVEKDASYAELKKARANVKKAKANLGKCNKAVSDFRSLLKAAKSNEERLEAEKKLRNAEHTADLAEGNLRSATCFRDEAQARYEDACENLRSLQS